MSFIVLINYLLTFIEGETMKKIIILITLLFATAFLNVCSITFKSKTPKKAVVRKNKNDVSIPTGMPIALHQAYEYFYLGLMFKKEWEMIQELYNAQAPGWKSIIKKFIDRAKERKAIRKKIRSQ